MVATAIKDPQIKKLLSSTLDNGSSPAITCRPCEAVGVEGSSRGFLAMSDLNDRMERDMSGGSRLEIVLCSNRLSSEHQLKEVLTHELVHAYDYLSKRVNFRTCPGLAYTEIRAAREAECKGELRMLGIKARCIKRKAIQSTSSLFPYQAEDCVEQAFSLAVEDKSPFSD
jgi:hypothetical protein